MSFLGCEEWLVWSDALCLMNKFRNDKVLIK